MSVSLSTLEPVDARQSARTFTHDRETQRDPPRSAAEVPECLAERRDNRLDRVIHEIDLDGDDIAAASSNYKGIPLHWHCR